jgi:iron complex outermembrane receptor protein
MAVARQADREIYFSADLTRPYRAPALHGRLSVEAALSQLLSGTGLRYRMTANGAIVIERAPGGADAGSAAAENESAEIIVTGTNIRGVIPESSPLTVLTRRELDARGATTAEQAVNTFTQNFNSVNANATSADRASFFNEFGVNGVDLRGLGPGTTLVLLDGRRLSGSSNGRAVDVSQIPLAAVARIELLTDSASSVYGSDAVGGVVNFILLDRFDGLEARAGYGVTSDGGLHEYRGSLTGGLNWSTGNAVASASYLNRSALTTDERSFSRGVGGLYTLSNPQERTGLFLSARQAAGNNLTFTADGLYNRRTGTFNLFRDLGLVGGKVYRANTSFEQESASWFGALGATWRISDALTFDLTGSYSRIREGLLALDTSTLTAPATQTSRTLSQTRDITARASGRLFPLPGGDLAYSIGAGGTDEEFESNVRFERPPTLRITALERKRTTRYVFGELNIPLIGRGNGIAGVNRLEFNLSARYSDYSDFGGNFSPKIGVLWSITPGFNLRGSYGRTFRAPYLADIGRIGTYQVLNVRGFGLASPDPAGDPIGLYIDDGVDPDLGPETSNLLALGLDIRPPSVPRLAFSFTYVSIDYSNRIARGDAGRGTGYYYRPALYRDLYNFSPTREDIASIVNSATLGLGNNVTGFDLTNIDALAANVGYILDNRLRNIAESRQQAVDVTASYGFVRGRIDYAIGANATYILQSEARTTPSAPLLSRVNSLGRPVDFRANAYAGLSTGGFTARLTGNYIDSYANPFTPSSPHIDAWLTFDLTASYDFGGRPGPLSGFAVYLTVQNLFNTNPPYVADLGTGVTDGLSEPIGYDPSNANPLGRYVSIELRKRF